MIIFYEANSLVTILYHIARASAAEMSNIEDWGSLDPNRPLWVKKKTRIISKSNLI